MTQFEDGEFEWGFWSVKSLDEAKSEGLVEVERWMRGWKDEMRLRLLEDRCGIETTRKFKYLVNK
jgi:hypothetical protein